MLGGKILFEFSVAHAGWELDAKGWIVEMPDGERRLVLTNHEVPYFAKKHELDDLLTRYRGFIAETKKAARFLRRHPDRHPEAQKKDD